VYTILARQFVVGRPLKEAVETVKPDGDGESATIFFVLILITILIAVISAWRR